MNLSKRDVFTTQEAADRLGVSTTSIQKMVDRGELEAWITPGGHRRIYADSVDKLFQSARKIQMATEPSAPVQRSAVLKVLLAEDEPEHVALLKRVIGLLGAAVELTVAEDASQALIQIERQRPDVVITDLVMKPFDGFHLLRTITADPAFVPIDLVVITGMSRPDIEQRGGLPAAAVLYSKPVSVERLMGFMDAALARVLRRARTAPV
jgi:excisionase family DNA binding protein